MAKELLFGTEAKTSMQKGIDKVADAVKITLGPRGRNAILDRGDQSPIIINDGATIAKAINLTDPYENLGAQLIKEVATKTNLIAGDGTSTATVLTQAMVKEGLKNITAGANPVFVRKGMNLAVEEAIKLILDISQPVDGLKDIARVASISSADENIGALIAQAMDKVGKEGVITIEESNSLKTELEIVEGIEFDRGYISSYMCTDKEKMEVTLHNPYIILTDKKLSSTHEILALLEAIVKEGREFLIIADDVDGEALQTLVVNTMRGTFRCAAVKCPGFGERKEHMLNDIATLTGGVVISDNIDLSTTFKNVTLNDLGSAETIKITKDSTTIINGNGNKELIENRANTIRHQLLTASNFDKEHLEERLAKLSGGVAVIKVGAATETELKEQKLRIEDALNATKAAVKEGIVPGGGTTYMLVKHQLATTLTSDNQDVQIGINIILSALEAPLRQIASNGAISPDLVAIAVITRNIANNTSTIGYDAYNDNYVDMIETGIVDPTTVTRSALQHSASVASTFLTTEAAIINIE